MNLVTVLMTVYNTREDWLRQAIESILGQSLQSFEFLIITDGPTDNSREIVEAYAKKYDRIRVVHNEKNIGLIKTLNKGLSLAEGQYIARMDSDDIAIPDRLKLQLEYIQQSNDDLVGGRLQKINGNGNAIGTPTLLYTDSQVRRVIKFTDCMPHPTYFETIPSK